MSRRVNVRGIIVKDGKLFGVRHRRPENEADFWCTPGGGLDDRESLIAGMKREILEETGVTAEIGRLLYIQQFNEPDKLSSSGFDEFLEFFFHIKNADDFDNIDLSTTSHGTQELAEFGWVDPKEVTFLPLFLQQVDIESGITENSPVVITDELSES